MIVPLRRALEAATGLLTVVAAVVWLSGGCGERIAPEAEGTAKPPAPPSRATARVEAVRAPISEWVSATIASARSTAIASRILARVEHVAVRAGSEVSQDDLLVRLDARALQARAGEIERALEGARAALDLARTERQRVERLVAQGVATRQRLDQAESQFRVARAEVERLQESLAEARTALSYTTIRSPVTGRVVDRLAEPGDTVVPGEPLLRIYDPSALRAEAPVRESLAVHLQVGQLLPVEIPALERRFEAAIEEIVPFADPGARTLLVKVRVPSQGPVFAGMYARVAVPAGERTRLLAPEGALVRIGELRFVDVLPPSGDPVRRVVTLGPRDPGERIEILSGVREGDVLLLQEPEHPS